jgi:hypothetical protein
MRVAALILSIVVFGVMALQSCSIMLLGSVAQSLGSEQGAQDAVAGAGGVFVSIVTLVALAFVWGLPFVAMILYLLGALFAFGTATMGFPDMQIWGYILIVLSIFAFFGWREKRRKNWPAQPA